MTDDEQRRLELGTVVKVTTGTIEVGNMCVQPHILVTVTGSTVPDDITYDQMCVVVADVIDTIDPDGIFVTEARKKARRQANGLCYSGSTPEVRYTLVHT